MVKDDGSWSFTPPEDLDEGDHSIVIIEIDKPGNTSKPSDPYEFTVDTTAPDKPQFGEDFQGGLDDVGTVTGPIAPGDKTDDARPEFIGTGEPGSKIIIKDNDKEIGTTVVKDDGSWSFTPPRTWTKAITRSSSSRSTSPATRASLRIRTNSRSIRPRPTSRNSAKTSRVAWTTSAGHRADRSRRRHR